MRSPLKVFKHCFTGPAERRSVEGTKHLIQQGLKRYFKAQESQDEQGLVTVEFGEEETLQFPTVLLKRLVDARYGVASGADMKDALDVTDRIRVDVEAGRPVKVTNTAMGGDPQPGVRKVLRVRYKQTTEQVTVSAGENQTMELPDYAVEGIVKATYGEGESTVDVSQIVQQLFLVNADKPVQVDNDTLGGDPCPGMVKTLTVTYEPRPPVACQLNTDEELATFVLHAPWHFAGIRKAIGLTSEDYSHSLTRGSLQGGEKQESGKSGEIFWFSNDRRFVLKTISNEEIATLVNMLPNYHEYLARHPDSFLTRYFGVYSLFDNGNTTQFVVMNNVFEGAPEIDVMYDLKGTTEDRWVEPGDGRCLKDNNLASSTLFISDDSARALHSALAADTAFLQQQGIMDYSLMLGVRYDPDAHDPDTGVRYGPSRRPYSQLMGGLQGEEATGVLAASMRECILYVGMVDMLVTYGWKKVVAHQLKAVTIGLWDSIDTVPPERYAKRFRMYLGLKVRGHGEKAKVTEVSPEDFEAPLPSLARSGGTAAFFRVLYREGAQTSQALQSRAYWIGKDLARSRDEVAFYETAKSLEGVPEFEMLRWMTPYLGVCRVDCEVVKGEAPKPLDVMMLRNCRDGFETCRMLDIKIGQVTAVGGWQGKSAFRAFLQTNTVDAVTNSAGQGFRLEGFDNPPPALRSVEDMIEEGTTRGVASVGKLKRFNLQMMTASQFLGFFLDLHGSASSSYAKKHDCYQGPVAEPADPALLSRVETQELVLLNCIEELAGLVSACRKAPAAQMWIGSSVMLCFDSGRRPPRDVLSRGPRAWNVARVHIFDWGRSELNTLGVWERLEQEQKTTRAKYWNYYCGAVGQLLYDCCNTYVRRFWFPNRCVAFSVWDCDKNKFSPDDFCGFCVVPLEKRSGRQSLTTSAGALASLTSFLSKGDATLGIDVAPAPLASDSRLSDCWVVKVHDGLRIPCKDLTSPSDGFVEVMGLADSSDEVSQRPDVQRLLRDGAHTTTVAMDTNAPVWEEEFEIATLDEGAKTPFLAALALAFGETTPLPDAEALVKAFFPCRLAAVAAADSATVRERFVARCFPDLRGGA